MAQAFHLLSWAMCSMDSFDQKHHQDGITIKKTFIELNEEVESKGQRVSLRRCKSDSCLPQRGTDMLGVECSGHVRRKRRVPVNDNTTAVMFDVPEGMEAFDIQDLLDQCDAELNGGRRSFDCLYCPRKNGKVIGYCEVNFLDHDSVMRAIQRLAFTRFNGCNKTIRFSQKQDNDGRPLQGREFVNRYMQAASLMGQGTPSGLLFFGDALVRAMQVGYGNGRHTRFHNKRGSRGKKSASQCKNISCQMQKKPGNQWSVSGGARGRNNSRMYWDIKDESHGHWSSDNSTACPEEIPDLSEEDITTFRLRGGEEMCWSP